MAGLREKLTPAIIQLLEENPQGLSEYALLKQLQQRDLLPYAEPGDHLALYRLHFILYHHLYRLRDVWWQSQQAHLVISALQIQKQTYQAQPRALQEADPLRSYYLDLSQMEKANREDVNQLINAFWKRLGGREQRQEALRILGLEDPVDRQTIRQQYRKLVMQHHPDRGGDARQFHLIKTALELLL